MQQKDKWPDELETAVARINDAKTMPARKKAVEELKALIDEIDIESENWTALREAVAELKAVTDDWGEALAAEALKALADKIANESEADETLDNKVAAD